MEKKNLLAYICFGKDQHQNRRLGQDASE